MKEIQVEGMKYIYLAKNEGLPQSDVMGLKVQQITLLASVWNTVVWENFDDMRLILINYDLQPDLLYINFLHWDDRADLDVLDKNVSDGRYRDNDFQNAVITSFGRTFCTECNWEGYTLVFFTSEAYIDKPELEQAKIKSRQLRQGFLKCPNCDTKFRQMVVKVFKTPI